MPGPFRLLGGLLLALFRILGYTVVALVQVAIYLSNRRPDMLGDAVGEWGRGVTDTLAGMFRL